MEMPTQRKYQDFPSKKWWSNTPFKRTQEKVFGLCCQKLDFLVYRMELSSLDNLLLEMALGLISGLLELFIVRMIGLLKTPVLW